MGVTIFAAKDGVPVSRLSRPLEVKKMMIEAVYDEQASVPELADIRGADFSTSAGNFSTICELLDLPNRVNEFDPEAVIKACDAALLDLDNLLVRLRFGLVDREFHFQQLVQVRDIAVVGLSRGADKICAY